MFLARDPECREDFHILVDILDMSIRNRNHSGHSKGAECNNRICDLEKESFQELQQWLFLSLAKLHGLHLNVCLSGEWMEQGLRKSTAKTSCSLTAASKQLWECGCNNITLTQRICSLGTFTRYRGMGTFWKKKLKSHILCCVPKFEIMSRIHVKTLQYFSLFCAFLLKEC